MTVTTEKPEIIRFIYRQEKSDKEYGSCLWAIFDIDASRGMLNIQSDCGDFAHRWPERGQEFLRLLHGVRNEYLIHKLCGLPECVNIDLTVRNAEYELEQQDSPRIEDHLIIRYREELRNLLQGSPDKDNRAGEIIEEWNSEHKFEIDQAYELAVKEYYPDQRRIAKIFCQHIQPKISSFYGPLVRMEPPHADGQKTISG